MTDVLTVGNQYRLEQWSQLVAECQASGKSNRQFCQERGISEKTYYYWLRRLRVMAVEQAVPELIKLEAPKMPETETGTGAAIRVSYHDVQLDIPSGMDKTTIAAVLASIKSLC